MKHLILFSTKLYIFLIELPPVILLYITISLHDKADNIWGFYPLEIVLSLVIIFIMIYFSRAVSLSSDELRAHGLFSSRDKAFIKAGNTMRMSVCPKNFLRIELMEDCKSEDIYSWMKKDNSVSHNLSVFRERVVGGNATVAKILIFYGVDKEIAERLANNDGAVYEDENISVKSASANEIFFVDLTFKTTIV